MYIDTCGSLSGAIENFTYLPSLLYTLLAQLTFLILQIAEYWRRKVSEKVVFSARAGLEEPPPPPCLKKIDFSV